MVGRDMQYNVPFHSPPRACSTASAPLIKDEELTSRLHRLEDFHNIREGRQSAINFYNPTRQTGQCIVVVRVRKSAICNISRSRVTTKRVFLFGICCVCDSPARALYFYCIRCNVCSCSTIHSMNFIVIAPIFFSHIIFSDLGRDGLTDLTTPKSF